MSIVGGFDVHRRQLTFEYLDDETGELRSGRVAPADREHLRRWLRRFDGIEEVSFALEGCTGWRYVAEELTRAGAVPHLAEPADTAALRGRKRHAKTDKADARHLRVHLMAGDLPESWIPPEHVLEARTLARLYRDLLDERGGWHQRIAATLFHQGVPVTASMSTTQGRAAVAQVDLSPAGRQAVDVGLRQIDRLTVELDQLRRQLDWLSRHQPGARALRTSQYGVGAITSVAIWAELGDVRRFRSSTTVVRPTGLDVTVHSSDTHRAAGHLSRQGPQLLRWALYESANCAARTTAPDHDYYPASSERRTAGLATITGGPQAGPTLLPHPARTRRGGADPRHVNPRSFRMCRSAPSTDDHAAGSWPAVCCQPRTTLDSLHRMSGRIPPRVGAHTPSSIM